MDRPGGRAPAGASWIHDCAAAGGATAASARDALKARMAKAEWFVFIAFSSGVAVGGPEMPDPLPAS